MAFEGYRHLFASIPGDGAPGFQTAAAAAELGDGVVRELEKRVGSFRLAGRQGERSRQVLRYDDEGKYTLLTTFTLLGTGPDGRPGNYLAESLLVPNTWLAGLDWDFAAAIDAVEWWGPEALDRFPTPRRDLPSEALPEPRLQELSRLAGLVAAGDHFDRLLLALVRAVQGRERLRVVEADTARPPALDELVALLPLAVPPVCRRQPASAGALALTLRTRGPVQGMTEVALAGLAAADRSDADERGVLVVDLGGQLPTEDIVDVEAYDYADWAGQAIRGERWEELERLYAAADEVGEGQVFRRFRDLLRRLEAAPAAARDRQLAAGGVGASGGVGAIEAGEPERTTALPRATHAPKARPAAGPVPGRKKAPAATPEAVAAPPIASAPATGADSPWEEHRHETARRRVAEGAAAEAHDGYREEIDELARVLRQENEEARQKLQGMLEEGRQRAAAELEQALAAWSPELQKTLEAERARLLAEIKGTGLAAQKQLLATADEFLDKVRQGDPTVAEWTRQTAREVAEQQEALAAPEGEKPRRGTFAWFRQNPRRRRWAAVAGAVLLAPLLVLAGWMARGWFGGSGTEEPPAVTEEQLLERLQQGPAAAALLSRAAEDEDLAGSAASLGAALLLEDFDPGEPTRCVLLQSVLLRDADAQVGDGFAVDGDCQGGTWNALSRAITDDGCCERLPADPPPERRVACYLAGALALGDDERCDGDDPWTAERDWSAEEASRFLDLLAEAREIATPEARRHLPAAESLDVRTDTALDRVRSLAPSEAEARELLDLARALVGEGEAPLEEIEALLAESPAAAPLPEEAGTPTDDTTTDDTSTDTR